MRSFYADLHTHSFFAKAPGMGGDIFALALWGMVKGIQVIGTGDITHPAWQAHLQKELRLDYKSGLFMLMPRAQNTLPAKLYGLENFLSLHQKQIPHIMFMLQGEVCCLYKRAGRSRKIHLLLFLPTFSALRSLCSQLARFGDLAAQGVPQLKLAAKDVLEMTLGCHEAAFVIPAGIWEPSSGVLNAKTGFDSLDACFGTLTKEIFALETGISSTPPMNRLWSELDQFSFISASKATSYELLGSKRTKFSGMPSYHNILSSLVQKNGSRQIQPQSDTIYLGTVDTPPEMSPWYLTGHKRCKNVLPSSQRHIQGQSICPECKVPLQAGVLDRVFSFADRDIPLVTKEETIIQLPLLDILAEINGEKKLNEKTQLAYIQTLEALGPEARVLDTSAYTTLESISPPLAIAIRRMHQGQVTITPGYDGKAGTALTLPPLYASPAFALSDQKNSTHVKILPPQPLLPVTLEAQQFRSVKNKKIHSPSPNVTPPHPDDFIFSAEPEPGIGLGKETAKAITMPLPSAKPLSLMQDPTFCQASFPPLNEKQKEAAMSAPSPVLLLGGGGTGKTTALQERVQRLLDDGISPKRILVITHTQRAAQRIKHFLTDSSADTLVPCITTLLSLAAKNWNKIQTKKPTTLSDNMAWQIFFALNMHADPQKIRETWEEIALAHSQLLPLSNDASIVYINYQKQKNVCNLVDAYDLLRFFLEQLKTKPQGLSYEHILVDDLNVLSPLQLSIIKELTPLSGEGFFGTCNPMLLTSWQRPNKENCLSDLRLFYPGLKEVALTQNVRSTENINSCAEALAEPLRKKDPIHDVPVTKGPLQGGSLHLFSAPTDEVELDWLAEKIIPLQGHQSCAVAVRTASLAQKIASGLQARGVLTITPKEAYFWENKQAALLISMASGLLGIEFTASSPLFPECPAKILIKGPRAMAAYLQMNPHFTSDFWLSSFFQELCKAYEKHHGWTGLINWIFWQTDDEFSQRHNDVLVLPYKNFIAREFSTLFLPCLEDGLVPFAGANLLFGKFTPKKLPSKKRELALLYQVITTCSKNLYLSYAAKRTLGKKSFRFSPSPFLSLLPQNIFTCTTVKRQTTRTASQLSLMQKE